MVNGTVTTNKRLQSFLNSEFLGTTSVPTVGVIGTGTSTPSVGDTTLGNQTGSFSFQSGFPAVDTGALKATERWKISTTDNNGEDLTEHGSKDASGNLKNRSVYQAVSKSNTKLVTFVTITKIRNKE